MQMSMDTVTVFPDGELNIQVSSLSFCALLLCHMTFTIQSSENAHLLLHGCDTRNTRYFPVFWHTFNALRFHENFETAVV